MQQDDPGSRDRPSPDDRPGIVVQPPATLEEALARIGCLEMEASARDQEVQELKDRLLRERADLENFKKRIAREKAEALRFANEPLLRDLLPMLDNLQRAIHAAESAGAAKVFVDGVRMVATSFQDALGRFGVTRIHALGEPFDPNRHEALAQVENADAPPGTVIEEHAAGWLLHDRLLRPAQVIVSRGLAS